MGAADGASPYKRPRDQSPGAVQAQVPPPTQRPGGYSYPQDAASRYGGLHVPTSYAMYTREPYQVRNCFKNLVRYKRKVIFHFQGVEHVYFSLIFNIIVVLVVTRWLLPYINTSKIYLKPWASKVIFWKSNVSPLCCVPLWYQSYV